MQWVPPQEPRPLITWPPSPAILGLAAVVILAGLVIAIFAATIRRKR